MRLGIGEDEWRGWMLDDSDRISIEVDDSEAERILVAFKEFGWAMNRIHEAMLEQHPEFPSGRVGGAEPREEAIG